MNRVIRLLALTTASLFLSTISIAPTYSHSALVTSLPKADAILSVAPEIITLKFNEEILEFKGKRISTVSLLSISGRKISLKKARITANILSTRISPPILNSGKYRVTYRVVSSDGHVISGGYTFTVAQTQTK